MPATSVGSGWVSLNVDPAQRLPPVRLRPLDRQGAAPLDQRVQLVEEVPARAHPLDQATYSGFHDISHRFHLPPYLVPKGNKNCPEKEKRGK